MSNSWDFRRERDRVVGLIESDRPIAVVVAAYVAFDRALLYTDEALGRSRLEFLEISLDDRRRAVEENVRAADAAADLDVEGALRHVVRALLADPANRDAATNFALLKPLLGDKAAFARIQTLIGEPGALDVGQLRTRGTNYAADPFRGPVTPLPLDGRKGVVFFHQPDWTKDSWREVLHAYLGTFSGLSDTTLVFWLDPAQGVSQGAATDRLIGAIADALPRTDTPADVLLVPDNLSPAGMASLYSGVDWIVPNGDARQEDLAFFAGVGILTDLEPQSWRAAFAQGRRAVSPAVTYGSAAPKVSCLVINYNYGRYLAEAIESVLAQNYPTESLEIIVVDDGSTDNSADIVEPFLDRLQFVRKPNGGLVSAVQSGLEHATGEFIGLLDADDTWPADKTRRQVNRLLAKPEVGLVYGDMILMDEAGRVVHPSFFAHEKVTPLRGHIYPELCQGNFISGGSILVRASLKKHFVPIDPAAAWPDWWIATQVAAVAPIDLIGGSVYNYRFHGDNMGLNAGGDKLGRHYRTQMPFRRWVLERLPFGAMTLEELIQVYALFEWSAKRASALLGIPIDDVVAVDFENRSRAEQLYHEAVVLARKDRREEAMHRIIQSLGQDPWHCGARTSLRSLVPQFALSFGAEGRA